MKLATIERILDIQPIAGADRIEKATVLNYSLVVKKGEFKIGDLCVFHHIDTVVDKDSPVYAFLAKNNFRIKTIRLKGIYSQGLALPLSTFNIDLPEGSDVADIVKIQKYERPLPAELAGVVKGNFPSYIPKTDEPNLQSYPNIWAKIFNRLDDIEATVKYDGSSLTAHINDDGEFCVCSRNLSLKETESNSFWKMARKYNLEKFLRENPGHAIQGEIYGPGIQGNPLKESEIKFAAFSLYDISQNKYVPINLLEKYDIPTVRRVTLPPITCFNDLLDFADSITYAPGVPAEGIVLRVYGQEFISGKVLSRKYDS